MTAAGHGPLSDLQPMTIMKRKKEHAADAGQLVENAQALLVATGHLAEEKIVAARQRLAAAVNQGREILGDLKQNAVSGARAADETIREHPYHTIGVALAAGWLLGLFLNRRR